LNFYLQTKICYGTIYIDPPWSYTSKATKIAPDNKRKFKYNTMTLDEIGDLFSDIQYISLPESHLWMWTTKDFRKYAEGLMEEAGFEFKTEFIWVKGDIRNGNFVRHIGGGHYNRLMHEYLLLGVSGNLKTLNGSKEPSVIIAPKEKHSKKPDVFYELIERNSPFPRLEVFARQHRCGWDTMGDQLPKLRQGGIL